MTKIVSTAVFVISVLALSTAAHGFSKANSDHGAQVRSGQAVAVDESPAVNAPLHRHRHHHRRHRRR